MANLEQFLNKSGVSTLWGQIAKEISAVDTKAIKNASDIASLQETVRSLQEGTYDDSGLRQLIGTNTSAIEVLNGTGEGSVAATVAAKITEVVAGADASFDTLKEIADWILNDTTGAASMTADISALEAKLEGVNETVVKSIAAAIEAALKVDGVDKYALASEVTTLANQLSTISEKITALEVAKHSHANLETLNGITAAKISAWDAAEQNAKDYTDSVLPTALTEAEILEAIQTAKDSGTSGPTGEGS